MLLLYVDDDPDDVAFFKESVQSIDPGSRVIVAENGLEAINSLNILNPDIIFLDVNMPLMNGAETLRIIRLDNRLCKIPVYVFSTSTNPEEWQRFMTLGAMACIVKPDSMRKYCTILQSVLQQHATVSITENKS